MGMPVLLTACNPISLREVDEAAGPNGGFEVVRPIRGVDGAPEGLPVNWYFYAKPLLEGRARLTLDRNDPAEGLQSLHLAVEETDSVAVRRTGGLFQVFPAIAGRNYRVSFRMKIAGARAIVMVRSESVSAATEGRVAAFDETDAPADAWRAFQWVYTVPEGYDNLRFELNVVRPGSLWLDDVRIEEIAAPDRENRSTLEAKEMQNF
jgi:hypothetical protein